MTKNFGYSDGVLEELLAYRWWYACVVAVIISLIGLPSAAQALRENGLPILDLILTTVVALFHFVLLLVSLRSWAKKVFKQTRYSIEDGFLLVRCNGTVRETSINLGSVSELDIGDIEMPSALRMRIRTSDGKEMVVRNLTDMEEFIAEIRKYVLVAPRFLDEKISPFTKKQVLFAQVVGVVIAALFTRLLYECVHTLYYFISIE